MLKGLANFPREEITLVVSLNIQKIRGTKFRRSIAAKNESIQEDLLHQAPLHHLHTLPVVTMKRDRQEDPSPGPSDQRRKRSTSQKARILVPIMKMVADQFPSQNSLGHQELIVVKYLVLYDKIVFMQIVNYSQLYFYDKRILYRFVILCYILCCLSRS